MGITQIAELEAQAEKMVTRVEERRKNGQEGVLAYIQIPPDDNLWMELDESKYRGMFQCAECLVSTLRCPHNPFINGTIKRVVKTVTPQMVTVVPKGDDQREVVPRVPGQRGKPRRTLELTNDLVDEALRMCNTGSTVGAAAVALNVNPNELSKQLKKQGYVPKKGPRDGQPRGREKTTVAVTPEMVTEAITRYNSGEGCTALAKEFNVQQPELSKAMKAKGCEVKQGRRVVSAT